MNIYVVYTGIKPIAAFVHDTAAEKFREDYNIERGGMDYDKAFVCPLLLEGFEASTVAALYNIRRNIEDIKESIEDISNRI